MHRIPLAALWLAALAVTVVLAPVWIPGDGLVWKPGPRGLTILKIAQPREVSFSPGQRIVFFNGTPWELTRALHQQPPFYPLQSARISYELREGEWKLRRQVLQAPLPVSLSLRTHWLAALVLLSLALIALIRRKQTSEMTALALLGSAVAIWEIANQNLTSLTFFKLRHLELTALLLAFGLGALLRRFLPRENRLVKSIPWIAVMLVATAWTVQTDRWQWWSMMEWGLATLAAFTGTAMLVYRFSSAKRFSGS